MFSDVTDDFVRDDLKYVEVDSLGERSALTNDNNVSFLYWECRWAVYWDVSMSFLISVVFGDIVEIISSDHNGSLHFCWDTNSLKNLASNWDIRSEGTLSIDVFSFDGLLGGLESQSDILVESDASTGLFGK